MHTLPTLLNILTTGSRHGQIEVLGLRHQSHQILHLTLLNQIEPKELVLFWLGFNLKSLYLDQVTRGVAQGKRNFYKNMSNISGEKTSYSQAEYFIREGTIPHAFHISQPGTQSSKQIIKVLTYRVNYRDLLKLLTGDCT